MKQSNKIRLHEEGKKVWQQTDLYQKRVEAIKSELSNKYEMLITKERNWFKRQFLKIQFQLELNKRIAEISSTLHLRLIR